MEAAPGAVLISPKVITTVVRLVAEATPGVAHLRTTLPGRVSRVFRGNRSSAGIDIDIQNDAVTIDVYIIACPNTPLHPLGLALQREVSRAISDMVGMPVRAVNIHIVDVQDPFGGSAH